MICYEGKVRNINQRNELLLKEQNTRGTDEKREKVQRNRLLHQSIHRIRGDQLLCNAFQKQMTEATGSALFLADFGMETLSLLGIWN